MSRRSTGGRKFDHTFRNSTYPVIGILFGGMMALSFLMSGVIFGVGGLRYR